ncbi:hypothetical protein GCM10011391_28090 [Pullulanibacillus camelliae]|uniref:DUF4355 domain-containing protein n=1 Tax=Pullulanibacillus camelliae TaxID=1707096 RepID=A0A8J3DX48_9BACL|nr:hypothetical protein [Pullulanibacillus camelliae]GGE47710.1 hypothetical protein GCM10011391_28090 [Pullulanibacillus camelliae]
MQSQHKMVDQLPKKVGVKYPLNLQFFAEVETNTDNQPVEQEQKGTEQETQAGGQEQQTQDAAEKAEEQEQTFKQEDVNKIAAKEAKKAQEKLLKSLGIDDFDNAKEGMKKFKEWQESQKTEQEKQQEELKKLQENYSTASSENETLKAQISAMKSGVKADSVEDVVTLAKNLVDDDTDMDAAIAKVVEKYPHFKVEEQPQEDHKDSKKPSFTTGQHTKQPESEIDKWLSAFK